MKKLPLSLLFLFLAGSACQNNSLPPEPSTPTPIPPTPAVGRVVKNLIEFADLHAGKGPVYSQTWSGDGRWLATADFDLVRVWDTSTYQESAALEGHTGFIWGLAWSPAPDPLMLASASQDGSVRLWDAATSTQISLLETGWAFCLDWSPDGRQLAVGTQSGEVQIWDVDAQELLQTWKSGTHTSIISLAWSPDGQSLASGELGGSLTLWDVSTGAVRRTMAGYTAARSDVNGLDWSPDGSLLASAHQDGKIRFWNAETFELSRTLDAHTGWVRGVAFSPDGRLLASTGEDKRICLWDTATGQEYAEFPRPCMLSASPSFPRKRISSASRSTTKPRSNGSTRNSFAAASSSVLSRPSASPTACVSPSEPRNRTNASSMHWRIFSPVTSMPPFCHITLTPPSRSRVANDV